jgi:hypothetical protein
MNVACFRAFRRLGGPITACALSSVLLVPSVPAQAAPSGSTTTLEITAGAAALYYLGAGIGANSKSKGARKEAETAFGDSADLFPAPYRLVKQTFTGAALTDPGAYAAAVAAAKAEPSLSLVDVRAFVIAAVATSSLRLLRIPTSIPTPGPDGVASPVELRNDFEVVRTCWNEYAAAPAPASSAPSGASSQSGGATPAVRPHGATTGRDQPHATLDVPASVPAVMFAQTSPVPAGTPTPPENALAASATTDCLAPLSDPRLAQLLRIAQLDVFDADAAFTSAPSLVQQVVNQQVGGNFVENVERSTVLAMLSISFLDEFPPGGSQQVEVVSGDGEPIFPTKKRPADFVAQSEIGASFDFPSTAIQFGTACLFGGTVAGCIGQLSSIESQAVSGLSAADACALGRATWIPPYSRIVHPRPSDPIFGQPPGC